MDAPNNAAEAAAQLTDMWTELDNARTVQRRMVQAAAKAEHIYRTQKSRALNDPNLPGSNKEARDAEAHERKISADAAAEAGRVAESVGLEGWTPQTVGDLRWLRDRSEGIRDWWAAHGYDLRDRIKAWQTVASMAKAEAEIAPPVGAP